MLLRRTIAAMSLAVVVFVAVRLGVEARATALSPPLHRTVESVAPSGGARDWILENRLVDAVGRRISTSQEDLASRTPGSRGSIRRTTFCRSAGAAPHLPAERSLQDVPAIEAGLFFTSLGALAVLTLALVPQDAGVERAVRPLEGSSAARAAARSALRAWRRERGGARWLSRNTALALSCSSTTPRRTRSSCRRATNRRRGGAPRRRLRVDGLREAQRRR
jgi:hypothetical protein